MRKIFVLLAIVGILSCTQTVSAGDGRFQEQGGYDVPNPNAPSETTNLLIVVCDSQTGNLIYINQGGQASALFVIPGGCTKK